LEEFGLDSVDLDIDRMDAEDEANWEAAQKLYQSGPAKGLFGSIVKNEKGGWEITLPGRDKIFSIPKKIDQAWMDRYDLAKKNIGAVIGRLAQRSSRVDTVLTALVSKYGQDANFKSIKKEYELANHRSELVARRVAAAISQIDGVFESTQKQFKKTDFLAGKTGDQLVQAKRALDKRTKQIAQGGITAFNDKYRAVREASRQFEILEKELREVGMLNDHQFRELTRKERNKAVEHIRTLDSKVQEIADSSDTPLQKAMATRKVVMERNNAIIRLQVHYKNSGTNYLREIQDDIDQTERYMRRLEIDGMSKKWAKRRRNWRITKSKDGVLRVQRVKAKNSASTSDLVGKGITQEAHDLHMHEMFTNIAKSEEALGLDPKATEKDVRVEIPGVAPWATKYPEKYKGVARYVKIPKQEVQFGPLAGMHVEKHIYDDMKGTFTDISDLQKSWRKVFSTWKAGKTIYNPATTTRNFVSNIGLAAVLGDVNFIHPRPWKELMKSWTEAANVKALKTPTDQYAREIMEDTTIYKSSFTQAEIGQDGKDYISKLIESTADLAPSEALATIIKGTAELDPESIGMKREGLQGLGSYIYDQMEVSMKAVIYKDQRRKGKSISEAEAKAHHALFDYSDVPPAIRWMRNWYSPFVTFSFKALPRLAETAVRQPWKLAAVYGMSYVAGEMAGWLEGEGDEEREWKKAALPDYIDRTVLGMPTHYRIPYVTSNGRDKYLDLSFFLPWGGATDMSEGALNWVPSYLAPSNPLVTVPGKLLANKEFFFNNPITMDTDKGGTQFWKIAELLWNEAAPAALDFKKWDKNMGAVFGHKTLRGDPKYSTWDAMADYMFGIKFRNIDYMEQSMWRQKDLQMKGKEIQKETARQIKQAHSASGDPRRKSMQKIQRDAMEKMDILRDEYHERWAKENE
jgi:hypothetical protein